MSLLNSFFSLISPADPGVRRVQPDARQFRPHVHNHNAEIDIRRGEQQLFHASRPGASADNDEWVKRKVRLVNRFGHSSFYLGQQLKCEGKRIEEKFLLPESEYAAHGGCFPVMLKGTGMVGTITVSGLAQEEDHKLVVQAIRHHLEVM